MASGNPSSKRKSSSSHKKKPSKKSSEVKKGKRGRSRKRDKSKKLHRRDLYVSCSDDDSRTENSLSISASDSEDDYRGRKGRSRTREDVKGSKKKVKRSDSPVRKKRKRFKQSDGSKVKKKSRHGKSRREGSRRDVSVDSSSGVSRSSSEESDVEGLRGKTKGREKKGKKSLDTTSIGDDRYKFRSRSCSPCSGGSERSHYRSEDRLVSENYSRRLRSVLSVPDEREKDGGRYQSKVENKAEIIQAYDDCPSCKSNDSYDGGRKKESSYQAHVVPEKKRHINDGMIEDERRKESSHQPNVVPEKKNWKVEDAFTSKINMTQSAENRKGDGGTQRGKMDHAINIESTKTEIRSEVSSGIVSSEVGDLESILRQKALENFRNFRGTRPTKTTGLCDQKGGDDVGVKQSSTSKDEPVKTESSKESDSQVAGAKDIVASEMKNVSTMIMERVFVANSPKHGVQISDGNSKGPESCDTMHADDRVVDAKATEKKIINLGAIPKSNRGSLVYRRESSGDHPFIKQASEIENVSMRIAEGVSVTNSPKHGVQISDGKSKRLESCDTMCTDYRVVDAKATEKKIINFGAIRKPNRGSLVYRREPSGDHSSIKQASQSHDCSDGKSQETKNIPNRTLTDPPKAARGNSDPHEVNKASNSTASEAMSSITPTTGEHGSTEPGNAAKGGSEFEQKTMSVMRGGEMVQVSYKVYIPKKPPALARRQLKR